MASLSFLLNKLLLGYLGNQVVVSYSPIVEELSKTLCSYYLGADIWLTHTVFGILEAGYDYFATKSGERGVLAAVLSILGHSLFGGLTVGILYLSDSIFLGLVSAISVHILWNVTLIRILSLN